MDSESDGVRFSAALTTLEKYFERQLETPIKVLYFNECSDLSIEAFEAACHAAMAKLKWFPKIAELRELVEGDSNDQAQAAWNLFEQAVSRVGYYNSVWVEDTSLASAILTTFGGWTQACTALHPVYAAYDRGGEDTVSGRQVSGLAPEMVAAKRKEFIANYRNAKRENRSADRYLLGACETNNRSTSIRRGEFPATQPVGLIVGGVVALQSLEFSHGQLASGARQMLEQGQTQRLLSAPKPKMLMPAPDSNAPTLNLDEAIATGDETLDGLAMLREGLPERFQSKRNQPSLSPEETLERAKFLREQAAFLIEEEKRKAQPSAAD